MHAQPWLATPSTLGIARGPCTTSREGWVVSAPSPPSTWHWAPSQSQARLGLRGGAVHAQGALAIPSTPGFARGCRVSAIPSTPGVARGLRNPKHARDRGMLGLRNPKHARSRDEGMLGLRNPKHARGRERMLGLKHARDCERMLGLRRVARRGYAGWGGVVTTQSWS